MTRSYGGAAAYLLDLGVPAEHAVLIIDGLDMLTLGASISSAARGRDDSVLPFARVDPVTDPALAIAAKANKRSTTAVFAEVIRSFLRGALPDIPETAPPPRSWGRDLSGDGDGKGERTA
jgi:hypothetical protein